MSAAAPPLRPWRPSPSSPWDLDAAAHLHRRAGFGAPLAALERATAQDPADVVAQLCTAPAHTPALDELASIRPSVVGATNPDTYRSWLLERMRRSEFPLREKVALFWHGHFATSLLKVRNVDWMIRHYELFLANGLGRLSDLLDSVARDPAMLRWLDNDTNRRGHANENFARELFELFTLGVGHYTERDITEAARAFTGWSVLRDRFHFSQTSHDAEPKTVLGQTGTLGGEDVLRIALEQPAAARFIATKLLRFFVEPRPGEEAVGAVAATLRQSAFDIGATLRALFASDYFFSARNRRVLIKSPIEFAVGAQRTFGLAGNGGALVQGLREMGQDLLAPPNVAGWPGQRSWINTASWLARVNTAFVLTRSFDRGLDPERAIESHGRALFGLAPPERVRALAREADTTEADVVHALLCLPEAHLG